MRHLSIGESLYNKETLAVIEWYKNINKSSIWTCYIQCIADIKWSGIIRKLKNMRMLEISKCSEFWRYRTCYINKVCPDNKCGVFKKNTGSSCTVRGCEEVRY